MNEETKQRIHDAKVHRNCFHWQIELIAMGKKRTKSKVYNGKRRPEKQDKKTRTEWNIKFS